MRDKFRYLVLTVLLFLSVISLGGGEKKKTPWKISGQLEEACSCNAACPCWFDSKPSRMNCSGGEAFFIKKGNYGNVPLDGLAIAMMAQSPNGTSMMESFGKFNLAYLYIDDKANPEQRKALEAIATEAIGSLAPPEKMKVRYVPLTQQIQGKEHKVTLGNYGSFSGHLIEGGLGGASKIVNPPGADPIHKEYGQGRTTKITYTDAGQKWNFVDSNYMYSTFDVTSEDYQKFAAGLAQKMQQHKPKK